MTTISHDERRRTLVESATKRWVDALIDLGGRNNLFYYKDLKVSRAVDTGVVWPVL